MGLVWSLMSYVWPSATPKSEDESGLDDRLTCQEKEQVRHTWSLVRQNLQAAGNGFFLA